MVFYYVDENNQRVGPFTLQELHSHPITKDTYVWFKGLGSSWKHAGEVPEVAELFEQYGNVNRVAEELGLSIGLVTTYLPYQRIVYDLDEKSGNARRIDRWRERRKTK